MNRLVHAAKLIDGERVLTLAPSTQWRVQRLDLGAPGVREAVEDRPLHDGTSDETTFHGARLVTLAGKAVGDADIPPGSLLDELARYCHPGRRPWLAYRLDGQDERRVRLRADLRSAPLEVGIGGIVDWQASWRVPAGVFFGAEQTDVANPGEGEVGRTYPLVYDRVYPATTGLGTVLVDNPGSARSSPLVRIYGPVTGPRIENQSTGQALEFTGDLSVAAGDYLEVDFDARTVRMNGDAGAGANRRRYLDFAVSSWWSLQPGVNTVRFYPVTHARPAQAVLVWSPAYL